MNGSNIIVDFFKKGHPRTIKAKRNIIASLGLNGFSIIIGLILVPLTLDYLNPTKYGIWLTLSSIIGWFGFFDIGLGNGLRNKLAVAFAMKDIKLAKIYVSTTYASITLIIGGVYSIFLIVNQYLNWAKILNTPPEMEDELSYIALIVFTFFVLQFILKLIGVILNSDQLPAFNNAFNPIGSFIILIIIYIITKFSNENLLLISTVYSGVPVLIFFIASLYLFKGKYKSIRPSIKHVNFKYFKTLAGLGLRFFLLQIAGIVIFSTNNMIITQLFGPSEVTPYNIAFKYFGIMSMLFTIIMTPFWSAFTEAITLNDTLWIKRSINRLIKIWLMLVLSVLILLGFSNYFYHIWVGDSVRIPLLLSVFMGLYTVISTWNNIFAYFVNGVGKIKLQMYASVLVMIINIPISVLFATKFGMGSAGVMFGTCVSLLLGSILIPIQYLKIINNNDTGIWSK